MELTKFTAVTKLFLNMSTCPQLLHKRLCSSHVLLAPPALPPLHSARQQLDRYSPSFVALRTCALNAFLGELVFTLDPAPAQVGLQLIIIISCDNLHMAI